MLQNFLVAFIFSFLGSIPPGTLNLTVLQLGVEKKINIAWRFAIAAALIEYPYAWLAVTFQDIITSSSVILDNIQLISAIVMITFGVLNIWSATRPIAFVKKFQESGFRKGIILSILNPLIIPFWIGVTAFLCVNNWIKLSTVGYLQSYLIGISLGAFSLLILTAYLSKRMATAYHPGSKVKLIPGIVLLALGMYAFFGYLF